MVIEAMAAFGIVRTVNAKAVELSRSQIGKITVPFLIRILRQRDTGRLALPRSSNKHNSTRSAFSEKIATLTPFPSQVAPRGCGLPGHTRVPNSVVPLNILSECCIAGVVVSFLLTEELSTITRSPHLADLRPLRGKNQSCKRRQSQRQRVWSALEGWLRNAAAEIADVAAPIDLGITVEDLSIISAARHADTVIVTHNRCEIADDHHELIGSLPRRI